MKRLLFGTVGALLLAGAGWAADPQLVGLVMPEAQVVAGINVDQARNSPFGQFLLTQMIKEDDGLREFIALTGFDPRRDVREILIASTGQPGPKSALMLAAGSFDPAKIAELVRQKAKGVTVETYRGVTLIASDKEDAPALAFLSSTMAVAGDAANVRAAIDRRGSGSILPPDLAVKINQWSTSQDAWGVSQAPVAAFGPKVTPNPNVQGALNGELLQKIEQSGGGVKFGAQVQFTGEARMADPKDATALADVVRFLSGLLAGQTQGNDVATSVLRSVNVRAESNLVKLTAAIAQSDLERVIQAQNQPRKRTSEPKQARPRARQL